MKCDFIVRKETVQGRNSRINSLCSEGSDINNNNNSYNKSVTSLSNIRTSITIIHTNYKLHA